MYIDIGMVEVVTMMTIMAMVIIEQMKRNTDDDCNTHKQAHKYECIGIKILNQGQLPVEESRLLHRSIKDAMTAATIML
jgi:hypothetical protein